MRRRTPVQLLFVVLAFSLSAPAASHGSSTIAKLRKENAALRAELRAQSQLISRSVAASPQAIRLARGLIGGRGSLAKRLYTALGKLGHQGTLIERIDSLTALVGGDASDLSARIGALLASVGDLRGRLAGTEAANAVLREQIGAMEGQLDEMERQRATLTAQRDAATASAAALTAELEAARSTLGGTGTLADRIAAVNAILGGAGTTSARATDVRNATDPAASSVTTAITGLNARLGVGGDAVSAVEVLHNSLRSDPSQTDLATDLSALRYQIADTLSPHLEADIVTMTNVLGGTGSVLSRIQGSRVDAYSKLASSSFGAGGLNVASSLREVINRLQAAGDITP